MLIKIIKKSPLNMIFFLSIFIVILYQSNKIILAFIFRHILDNLNSLYMSSIYFYLFLSFFVIFSGALLFLISNVVREKVFRKKFLENQKEIIGKFLESYFNSNIDSGKFINTLNEDLSIVTKFNYSTLVNFISDSVVFLLAVIFSLYISPIITVVIIICSILSLFINKFFGKKINQSTEDFMKNKDTLMTFSQKILSSYIVIKAYKIIDFITNKFGLKSKEELESARKQELATQLLFSIQWGSSFAINSIWMIVSLFLVTTNALEISAFLFFLTLTPILNIPFVYIPGYWYEYIEAKTSYKRLEEFTSNLEEINSLGSPQISSKNGLFINNLNLTLDQKKLFKNFSFSIYEKEKMNLMGKSGSGKSTIAKVLLSEIKSDAYLIKNNNSYFGKEMLKYISYVPSIHIIYTGMTIAENITLSEQFDENKILALLDLVQLEFDYLKIVDDNFKSTISGGELQRIVICRALYKDFDYLILDEFTSSLDEKLKFRILDYIKILDASVLNITHDKDISDEFSEKIVRLT